MLTWYLVANLLYSLLLLYRVWQKREVRVSDLITCVLVILVGLVLLSIVLLAMLMFWIFGVNLLEFPPMSWLTMSLERLEKSKIGKVVVIDKPRE